MAFFLPTQNSILTPLNWQEVETKYISIDFLDLLVKPGLDLLSKFNLEQLFNWSCSVLNAAKLVFKNNHYECLSIFNGSKIIYSKEQLLQLIEILKPKVLILPASFGPSDRLETLADKIFYQIDTRAKTDDFSVLLYINYHSADQFASFLSRISTITQPLIVSGDFSLTELKILNQIDNIYMIESTKPIIDAIAGFVYTNENIIDIKDNKFAKNFANLSQDCKCIVCQQFTKAYLHHLYFNVPLLSHRYLTQHNISLINTIFC